MLQQGVCSYCYSTNIKKEIPYSSFVTLKIDAFNSQQVYADVCRDCGTVIRSYVEVQRMPSGEV